MPDSAAWLRPEPDLMTFRNPTSGSRSNHQISQERGTYY